MFTKYGNIYRKSKKTRLAWRCCRCCYFSQRFLYNPIRSHFSDFCTRNRWVSSWGIVKSRETFIYTDVHYAMVRILIILPIYIIYTSMYKYWFICCRHVPTHTNLSCTHTQPIQTRNLFVGSYHIPLISF